MSDEAEMMGQEDAGSVAPAPVESQDTGGDSGAPATPEAISQPEAQPQAQRPIWDAFRSLPDFQGQDDTTLARNLYAIWQRERQAARALAQYQQHIPVVREYLANKSSYEQWLASQRQQQQAPAAQPEKPKFWNPPEIKEQWKNYLTRDEKGQTVISPDAPLDARDALMARQQYVADFAKKFLDNPEEALGPMVQDIAQRQAAEIVQAQLQAQAEERFVQDVEEEHAEWLFEDGDRSRPSEAGLMARQFVDQAIKLGIRDPRARWEYASSMVEHALQRRILEQQQQAPAPAYAPPQPAPAAPNVASPADRDMNFLRRAATRNPSRAPMAGESQPSQPMTFEQMLTRRISS